MTYIAPELLQDGYIGATGTTPHVASTSVQVVTLQSLYAQSLANQNLIAPINVIQLTLNFDGTQNNSEYIIPFEVQTNVANLWDRQQRLGDPNNSFYYPGIGAQTKPSGEVDENGNPALGSSPSNWESTPWRAGENGNQIIEQAFENLKNRVTAILATDPTAQISLNLTGFSRGSAQAVAFANLLNERGISGLYPPGEVPINSMVLFDPVSQTDGLLNVNWPTNLRNPALVFVATAENRTWFPAMPVGADSIIVPIEGVHSDVGGSFNQGAGVSMAGISAKFDTYTNVANPAVNGVSWMQAA